MLLSEGRAMWLIGGNSTRRRVSPEQNEPLAERNLPQSVRTRVRDPYVDVESRLRFHGHMVGFPASELDKLNHENHRLSQSRLSLVCGRHWIPE